MEGILVLRALDKFGVGFLNALGARFFGVEQSLVKTTVSRHHYYRILFRSVWCVIVFQTKFQILPTWIQGALSSIRIPQLYPQKCTRFRQGTRRLRWSAHPAHGTEQNSTQTRNIWEEASSWKRSCSWGLSSSPKLCIVDYISSCLLKPGFSVPVNPNRVQMGWVCSHLLVLSVLVLNCCPIPHWVSILCQMENVHGPGEDMLCKRESKWVAGSLHPWYDKSQ